MAWFRCFICSGFLPVRLVWVLSVQHSLLLCSNNRNFPPGVAHLHCLRPWSLGVLPSPPQLQGQAGDLGPANGNTVPLQRQARGPGRGQPRNFCWHYWDGNILLPRGCSADGGETVSGEPAEKKGRQEEGRGRESESCSSLHHQSPWIKLRLRMNFSVASASNFPFSHFSLRDFSFWHLQLIYKLNASKNLTTFSDQKDPWKGTERKVREERQSCRQHFPGNVTGSSHTSKMLN